MNYKERLVLYGSYAIACTVPWIAFKGWIFAHTTSKAFIFYGVTSIIAAVWVYLYSVDIRYRFTKKELMLVVPLVLYVLWMTVSSIAAKNSAFAVWGTLMRGTGLLTLYATFLYTIIIFSLSKRHEGYIQRFTSLSVFAGIVVLLSIWFGDEGFNIAIGVLQKGSGGGVTGNSTIAGAYFLFVLGFTAFLIAIKDSVKKTWLWLFAICIICSPLFINVYGFLNHKGILGSARGAFGGIIIAAMVAGLVYLTLSSKRLLQILGIAGVVVGIVISCIVWSKLVTPGTVVHEKFIDAASGTRFAFWNISQKVMNERPFVGYGPENFSIAQARYFNPQFLSKNLAFEAWTDHPHNVYYDNGVAGGYPGIFFYALFVGSLIVIVYKNTKLSPAQRSILIGTIAGYVIQNLVAVEGFMTIFMLATSAGMIYGLTTSVSIQKPKCVRGWYVYIYVILCITGLFGAYQFGYLPAQKAKLFAEVLGSKLRSI
jgi:O-antigen ligase